MTFSSRSKALRQAHNELFEALQAYHRAISASPANVTPRRDASDRLASLCETLGLRREAAAIRSLQ